MFQGLQEGQLVAALEALLFVTDEPASVITLADMLEITPQAAEDGLIKLRDSLVAENRGIQLREVAGGWKLFSHPAYHELLKRYVLSWDTRKLSQAAMETLAIIAYMQPVTRSEIAGVRGVNSESSINSLLEKGLVREAGTASAPGNPVLYVTTRVFLEKFGLTSVADLPDLDQFAPDDKTRTLIRERLSVTHEGARKDDGVLRDADEEGVAPLDEVCFDSDDDKTTTLSDDDTYFSFAETDKQVLLKTTHDVLGEMQASNLGLVEKINFDELTFETDDE